MARTSSPLKSPWRTPADRAAEREEKRNAVLNAAAAAFAQSGYHGTSLDDIAARLGVTKPTIYYYARNKDDLVAAVAERGLQQIMAATQGDEQASGLVQLQHLIRVYAEVMTTDVGRCTLVIRESGNGPAATKLREYLRLIDQRMRDLLDLGMTDGSIAPCDARMTIFMIAGAINGIGQWYDPEGALSPALIAEKFANQLTSGLAPRG